MKYYLVLKMNEIIQLAKIQMNVEANKLSEIKESQIAKYCISSLI